MFRKAVVSLFIAMIGLFAFSGMASADPSSYPAPGGTGDPVITAPATGEAGGTVTVLGSGFAPNEAVIVSIIGPDGELQSTLVVADADGNISIPLPLVLSGGYSITANGLISRKSSTIQVLSSGMSVPTSAPVSAGPTQVVNGSVIVGVNNGTIIVNNGIIFYGEGFVAGENVTINIYYYGSDAVKTDTVVVVADADGKVRHETTPSHAGKVVYQATGDTSGGSGEVVVSVTGTSSDNGWAAVATTTVNGQNVVAVAPNGSYLASTGASIAGPIAIGGAALVAGLGLLFFGTRGAIRRKGGHLES